jgi:hypothetical protein
LLIQSGREVWGGRLPGVDLKVFLVTDQYGCHDRRGTRLLEKKGQQYLGEIRRHHGPGIELPPGERLQGFLGGLGVFVFDEDLADTGGLPAASAGARDFDFEDGAVFLALLLDVVDDF